MRPTEVEGGSHPAPERAPMKALVLSGGAGTRLRPITRTSPKQLLPAANKPILFYGLEAIADAGIAEVGIVVGRTGDEIREAVGDGSAFGLDVTYIPQEAPLGLAHAVLVAREFLGDDDFVMYLGDNIVVGGITELVHEFREERPDARILLARVADPRAFGVAELDGAGRVARVVEKPDEPVSDLALVGVYLFTPAIHEAVRSTAVSRRGELEITDAVQWLLDQGRDVRSTTISGHWGDTGTVADLLEVNRLLLEGLETRIEGFVDDGCEIVGRVRIDVGAEVRGSRVVGPAIVGPGSVVVDSYVGPSTSIGEGCRIRDSEIEYSIVLRDSAVEGVRGVEGALVGRDARLTLAPNAPAAHRPALGRLGKARLAS